MTVEKKARAVSFSEQRDIPVARNPSHRGARGSRVIAVVRRPVGGDVRHRPSSVRRRLAWNAPSPGTRPPPCGTCRRPTWRWRWRRSRCCARPVSQMPCRRQPARQTRAARRLGNSNGEPRRLKPSTPAVSPRGPIRIQAIVAFPSGGIEAHPTSIRGPIYGTGWFRFRVHLDSLHAC